MTSYPVSNAPHLRSSQTVPKVYWAWIFSLFPAILAAFIFSGFPALTVIGCAISGALVAEALAKKIFSVEFKFHDGNSILIGILFGLMCPAGISPAIAASGSFFAVLFGKELFGGTGQYPFHPALAGQAFIHVSFPQALKTAVLYDAENAVTWFRFYEQEALGYSWWKLFLGFGPGMLGETSVLAILLGGVFLISRRLINWEIPCLYLLILAVSSFTVQTDPALSLLSGSAFFSSFYLVTDPVTSPITRQGCRVYALLAGFLTVFARSMVNYFYVMPFALLIANALVPWIDARWRPARVKTS